MTDADVTLSSSKRASRIAWSCTLALLVGVAIDRLFFSRPTAEAGIYHEMVSGTANSFPFHFDRWLGIDAPVPQSAITMLKPNFIISRHYHELGQGRQVSLLVVQCKDSRDILGHYPPVCYVSQGWTVQSAKPRDWVVDGETIRGMRYVFVSDPERTNRELTLDNFMVLPNGQTARDMDEVGRTAQDSRLKHFGAAQVQIVYNGSLSESDRTEIFHAFAHELQPILVAVMRPGRNEPK